MLYRSRARGVLAALAYAAVVALVSRRCGSVFSGYFYSHHSFEKRIVRQTKTAVFSKLEWGELGEKAASLAHSLQSEDERKEWLELLEAGKEDWEEVKLVLGLLWQKAAEEGRDGGPLGYPMAFTRLVEGVYEGPDGNEILVADVEARLTQVPAGDPAGDPDLWRRAVALSCFKELSFVTRGL